MSRRHDDAKGAQSVLDVHRGAQDLAGKTAMVAEGHGVALIPRMLTPALRPDVLALPLRPSATRGIYLATPLDSRLAVALVDATNEAARQLKSVGGPAML